MKRARDFLPPSDVNEVLNLEDIIQVASPNLLDSHCKNGFLKQNNFKIYIDVYPDPTMERQWRAQYVDTNLVFISPSQYRLLTGIHPKVLAIKSRINVSFKTSEGPRVSLLCHTYIFGGMEKGYIHWELLFSNLPEEEEEKKDL